MGSAISSASLSTGERQLCLDQPVGSSGTPGFFFVYGRERRIALSIADDMSGDQHDVDCLPTETGHEGTLALKA